MDGVPTVFVIDDEEKVRSSLQYLIETAGWPVRIFDSAESFLRAVPHAVPGCILLDIRMPGMTGIELQQNLKGAGRRTPIILITAHGDIQTAVRAISDGAFDFIEKPVDGEVLINRVKLALERDAEIRKSESARAAFLKCLQELTKREREVYDLVITGKTTRQVATTLDLSQKTVESHRSNIMRKMGTKSITELIHLSLSLPQEGN